MHLWKPDSRHGVSPEFERFAAYVIMALAGLHVLQPILRMPRSPIPVQVSLALVLSLVAYLWVARSRALALLVALNSERQNIQVETITALVRTIEAKDPYTHGHSERVQAIAVELAKALRLRDDQVATLARAAILHDIGKLGIPDAVLNNPGTLSIQDWEEMKEHPRRSDAILSGLGFLERESRIALLHHERVDGRGYVAGLRGEDIPLEASILAVADAFDAMNSDRPYRKKLPRDTILAELQKGKGSQHAPAVVDAFLGLLHQKPEIWVRA